MKYINNIFDKLDKLAKSNKKTKMQQTKRSEFALGKHNKQSKQVVKGL